ncbi:MAG: hypothetical protein WAX38_01775 [Minisyncoccia bacterium]
MDVSKLTANAIAGGQGEIARWCLPGGMTGPGVAKMADLLNSFVGASVLVLTALATLTVSVMLYSLLLKLKYKEATRIDVLAFVGSLGLLFCALYIWSLAGVVFRLFLTSDTALFLIFVSAIILNAVIALVYLSKGLKDIFFTVWTLIKNFRLGKKDGNVDTQ